MLFTEITEEDIIELRVEEVEARLEKAVEKRVEDRMKRAIITMLIKNKSVEEIHELTDVAIETILETGRDLEV